MVIHLQLLVQFLIFVAEEIENEEQQSGNESALWFESDL